MINKIYLSALILLSLVISTNAAEHDVSKADASATIMLSAIKDFSAVEGSNKVWYVDIDRQSLAVDAEKFKDEFGVVQTKFIGDTGTYTIRLTALTETDGESQYQVIVGDNELAVAVNPESDTDFSPVTHEWSNVKILSGSSIQVRFNSTSNGKIPEGDTTAYARGRWTKVAFSKEE